MSLNYVTLTLDLNDGQGNSITEGFVSFTPSAQLTGAPGLGTQSPIVADLSATPHPGTVKLLATDNAGVTPTGWGWNVAFSGVPGGPATFSFFLPFTGGASQNLSALTPVSSVTTMQAYLPLSGGTLTGPLSVSESALAGGMLIVANAHTTPSSPSVQIQAAAAADQAFGIRVSGDAQQRLSIDSNGLMNWGPGGSTAPDTNLSRGGAGLLQTNSGFKAQRVTASGITGAQAASRYVGGTSGGPPTTGTFVAGDFVLDNTGGCWWICTTGGSPGLWEAGGGNDYVTNQQLAAGETTIPRFNAGNSAALVSGTMILTYFTALKTETVNTIVGQTATTAAGATPTYAAMGLYSVASNGDLTLVGQCASDTTLFNATFTQFNRAVVTPFTKVAGQRYAFGYLVVSAAAMPNFFGYNGTLFMNGVAPRLNGAVSGQSSLPASVLSASVGTTSQMLAGAVTP